MCVCFTTAEWFFIVLRIYTAALITEDPVLWPASIATMQPSSIRAIEHNKVNSSSTGVILGYLCNLWTWVSICFNGWQF